ncbi:MAG: polysaccharide deacetylase family protein [Planctomycetota bacterium]
MYHDVVEGAESAGFRHSAATAYQVDLGEFHAQLVAIGKGPAQPVTVFEAARAQKPEYLLLTFDDGGRSALCAAEELEKHGWKGHFFITTGLIGTTGFLSEDDIRELHRRGHILGSHSHTHPNICYNLPKVEMLDEWQRSCEILAKILDEPVLTASVPGGDMNGETVATAAEAGIKFLFTSEPTFKPWQQSGITCFGRVCVKHDTSLAAVERLIRFQGFGRQMAIRRCKQLVKKLIGPIYRRRMPRSYSAAPDGGP